MIRWLLVCIFLLTCGCGSYFTGVGHDLTTGAMDEVTSASSKKHLTELAITAVRGARNEALGPTTQEELQQVVTVLGDALRAQLNVIISSLGPQLQQVVRVVFAELQKDVDALVATEVPKLTLQIQQSIQSTVQSTTAPIVKEADQQLAKWKPIAIAFAVGCGFLFVTLVFAFLIIRSHHKTIGVLLARGNET